MYLQSFNFQLSALTNRRQATDNLKQKLIWRWVPLAGACAVLFTAWSTNNHSRSVSQRLLWAQRTWWLTLQTFQVPFAMCSNNVFISCCLLNTGLAWVSPSRPFSSDLQAFSQSQRHPNAARAGAGPAERLQQNLGEAGRVTPAQYVLFSKTLAFPRDMKCLLQSSRLPGTLCFLLLYLLQVQPTAIIYFLKLLLPCSWIISFKAQSSPWGSIETVFLLWQMKKWGSERWDSHPGSHSWTVTQDWPLHRSCPHTSSQ